MSSAGMVAAAPTPAVSAGGSTTQVPAVALSPQQLAVAEQEERLLGSVQAGFDLCYVGKPIPQLAVIRQSLSDQRTLLKLAKVTDYRLDDLTAQLHKRLQEQQQVETTLIELIVKTAEEVCHNALKQTTPPIRE